MPPEILVAAIAAAAVLLITIGFASRPPKDAVQARLEQLVVQPKSLEEYELQAPFFERAVRPLVKRLARAGRRGDQGGIIARTDAKLEKAGYPGGLRGADWMGVKLLAAIAFAVLGFVLGLVLGGITGGLFFALVGAGVGFMGPEFWLGRKIRSRAQDMVLQLPDALDLLTISVEAGLGFDAALAKVVEKMEGPLVAEFRQALAEIRMGRSGETRCVTSPSEPIRSRSTTSSVPSCRPSSSACRSPRSCRSSPTSFASSAASGPRRLQPRRR